MRNDSGGLVLAKPDLLLDAWRDEYQFSNHTIIQGHVAARAGDALAKAVDEALRDTNTVHAATGLAAAWQLTRFAGFRLATFYLSREPDEQVRHRLGFREDTRGANLWFVVPNDEGVFHGANDVRGMPCVHPVQVYLDLGGHPERAPEAAERIRAEQLRW